MNNMLLKQVVEVARQAGAAIKKVYLSGEIGETSKADNSPLTLADLASHRCIVAELSKLTPDIPILSEEAADISFDERSSWSRYWLVDPLDGTKEFIKRNGQFTVNIALIEQGLPILGVVYAPALGKMYFGAKGVGAFSQDEGGIERSIGVVAAKGDAPIRIVASRSHFDERTADFLQRVGEYEVTPTGSSLKFCLVAEGEADVYPRFGPTMEWDTAAAQAVVEAAGGVVCDFEGESLRYNKEDLHNPPFLVTGMQAKDRMLAIINN